MNRIKELLKEKGKSQSWLASRLNKSFNMVNSYACNRTQPSLPFLYKIAVVLEVDPKELLVSDGGFKKNNTNELIIKSLAQLKQWNDNPTDEAPYMLDWFLRWFFDDVLMKDKARLAREAHKEFIRFTMICENITSDEATKRVNMNLGSYGNRSMRWWKKIEIYFPEIYNL